MTKVYWEAVSKHPLLLEGNMRRKKDPQIKLGLRYSVKDCNNRPCMYVVVHNQADKKLLESLRRELGAKIRVANPRVAGSPRRVPCISMSRAAGS